MSTTLPAMRALGLLLADSDPIGQALVRDLLNTTGNGPVSADEVARRFQERDKADAPAVRAREELERLKAKRVADSARLEADFDLGKWLSRHTAKVDPGADVFKDVLDDRKPHPDAGSW